MEQDLEPASADGDGFVEPEAGYSDEESVEEPAIGEDPDGYYGESVDGVGLGTSAGFFCVFTPSGP